MMPLTLIEIEHVNAGWVANVEIGGSMATRRTLNAPTIEAVLIAVCTVYRQVVPKEPEPPPAVPDAPLAPYVGPSPTATLGRDAVVRRGPGRPRKHAV